MLSSPQGVRVKLSDGRELLNFCANNYLGLSSHKEVLKGAEKTLNSRGYGLSSVRFICGTQDIHKELEATLSQFLGTEDTILYAAAFDANGGLFESLFSAEDAIISDQLNHASLIDGIRLCKAQRYRYRHNDMDDLKHQLEQAQDARTRIIATDGVFSMDGTVAQLDKICELATQYEAIVVVDDCHATGFMGAKGKGTHEHRGVTDHVDIITGTLGKALGGASGGFTSGKKVVIDMLRQRSRPYLFSNTLPPPVVGGALAALKLLSGSVQHRDTLMKNTAYFRKEISRVGFDIPQGEHPIVPIMVYDAVLSQKLAEGLLKEGIYVIGFCYPVVPKGEARVRVQISADHSIQDLNKAVQAFAKQGKQLGIV